MTAVWAALVTFGFTTLLTIAGVGAAFVLIPVFLALGVEVHTAMATALLLNAVAMAVASVNFVRKRLVVWKVALPMVVVASALWPGLSAGCSASAAETSSSRRSSLSASTRSRPRPAPPSS